MGIKTLDKAIFKNKKVLIRLDFNVPIDKVDSSKILDPFRIDSSIPTIKYILDQGAAKIILMSHLGRPDGKVNSKYSLMPIAEYLAVKLHQEVILTETCLDTSIPTLINLPNTKIVLLENLRFHKEEESNDPLFAEKLASYAQIYVNDAFGVSHRKHASVYEIIKFFPKEHYAGLLLAKEVECFEKILGKPQKPFYALMGGAKVSDKIKIIEKLLVSVDKLLIGGAMSYPFLKSKGLEVGKSLCSDDDIELAKKILQMDRSNKIILPIDHVSSKSINAENADDLIISETIPSDYMALDIGPKTTEYYQKILSSGKTIFWNGPMGLFEKPLFSNGTFQLAKYIATLKSSCFTIVGGGDSGNAVLQAGLQNEFSHLSTGGGASLEFIEAGELPGVQALKFGLN